ncbi:MAG: MBL fold metallo-hydrolase [Candidatus Pacearchaeota archaeon]|jgi:glyoxylase-like metal-dependent hydrolase (beta-lactamase superfamily II)
MINKLSDNVFQLYFKEFGSCVYFIRIGKDNILIDTSSKQARPELLDELKQLKIEPKDIHIILLTHRHYDHIENLELFPNAKVYDSSNIDNLSLIMIRVIKVPGHTNDSLAFLYKDILFSGDTLFHMGIGRTDLKESVPEKMESSVNTLKHLDYQVLAPGHI